MNEITMIENIDVKSMIYEVRGQLVMLDSDLARIYECTNGTKDINKAVKRNIKRFPNDFYFRLTKEEYKNILRFQNGTLELEQGKYSKYLPCVFTEEGVSQLSSVLRTEKAAEVSVKIMRAFVAMKNYLISNNLLEQKYVNNLVFELDERVKLLEDNSLKTFTNEIFFEGQIYDAYSLLIDIFNTIKISIVIVDNYISKELVDILSKTNKNVIIYTRGFDEVLINKYNSQYHNINIKINNPFHDRFIIVDNKVLYHSGASFKDLGKKCFRLSRIEDSIILSDLLMRLS